MIMNLKQDSPGKQKCHTCRVWFKPFMLKGGDWSHKCPGCSHRGPINVLEAEI
jgi:hypothetical protein